MTKRKEECEFLQTSLKVMRTFMTAILAIEHSFSKNDGGFSSDGRHYGVALPRSCTLKVERLLGIVCMPRSIFLSTRRISELLRRPQLPFDCISAEARPYLAKAISEV